MEKHQEYYEDEIDLMEYLEVLWKRKWLIIIPTFILVVLAGVISFLLPEKWEVEAILEPSKFFIQTEQGNFEEVLVSDPKQLAGEINNDTYDALIAAELNIDIKEFPKIEAENMRDTNLLLLSIKSQQVDKAKAILLSLFKHMKRDLDKKIDVEMSSINTQISTKENQIIQRELQIEDKKNEIKTRQNAIKKNKIKIESKELEIQSKEIEKDRIIKEIESHKEKIKISKQRVENILNEMKSVKERIDEIEEQQKKALSNKKSEESSISLLLYSNEIQQNLRYYNTLDEKLSNERINQENLQLMIKDRGEELRQIDNQISQIKNQKEDINADIEDIKTQINVINTEISKINNQIATIKNEILLLEDKKARIDYAKLAKTPTSSIGPVAPNKKRNVIIAGFLGIFLFTILAFFLEYIEKNKRTERK